MRLDFRRLAKDLQFGTLDLTQDLQRVNWITSLNHKLQGKSSHIAYTYIAWLGLDIVIK